MNFWVRTNKYRTRFIELLIEHTRTYFFQTLNIVQHVCRLVIELKLTFVERIDIVHIDPSLRNSFYRFFIFAIPTAKNWKFSTSKQSVSYFFQCRQGRVLPTFDALALTLKPRVVKLTFTFKPQFWLKTYL